MKSEVRLPIRRGRGGQSRQGMESYLDSLRAFAVDMIEIQKGLDFHMGARGWCYVLEPYGLNKNDFDWAQKQINEARLQGFLRPGFILEEAGHEVEKTYHIDQDPVDYVDEEEEKYTEAENTFRESWAEYEWLDFWKDKDCYIQILVEKADLKSLFRNICNEYRIQIANMRGWGSYEQKAVMAKRFAEKEAEGKTPVLLACGDHDPPGLVISDVLHKQFEDYKLFTGWDPKNLVPDRIGLNYDFIQENGLTWIENLNTGAKKGIKDLADPRHVCWKRNTYDVRGYVKKFGKRKVEANAIVAAPEIGRKMLIDAIERYVGVGAMDRHKRELQKRQKEIKALIARRLDEDE